MYTLNSGQQKMSHKEVVKCHGKLFKNKQTFFLHSSTLSSSISAEKSMKLKKMHRQKERKRNFLSICIQFFIIIISRFVLLPVITNDILIAAVLCCVYIIYAKDLSMKKES